MKPNHFNIPHGNMPLGDMRNQLLSNLQCGRNQLLKETETFLSGLRLPEMSRLITLMATLKVMLGQIIGDFQTILDEFTTIRADRAEYVRAVMHDQGVTKPYTPPNLWNMAIFVQFGLIVETVIVAMLMIGDGKMTVPSAVGYSFVYALINVLLGLSTGFLGLRFMLFKRGVSHLTEIDRQKRKFGRTALWMGLAALTLLIFVGARVRVTGGHEHIFSFWGMDGVSFFATFNDGMSIVLIMFAAFSSGVAIYKGYMVDPVPDLSKAYKHAYTETAAHMDDAGDDALERLDVRLDDVLDQLHHMRDQLDGAETSYKEGLTALNHARREHNDRVTLAKSTLVAERDRRVERFETVKGEALGTIPELHLEAFDALALPLISEADLFDPNHEVARLSDIDSLISETENLGEEHRASIEAALSRFHATLHNLSPVTAPKGVSL